MKRIFVPILVLAFAGLTGMLVRPWALRSIDKMEFEIAERVFRSQARRMTDCANDKMPYSHVIGAIKTKEAKITTLLIFVNLWTDPDDKNSIEAHESAVRDLQVVVTCADRALPWDSLVVVDHRLEVTRGFRLDDGNLSDIATAQIVWDITFSQDMAALFLQAPDAPEFIQARTEDGSVPFRLYPEFLKFYQNVANLDGKLMLGAAQKSMDWSEARKLLTEGK